MQFFASSLYSEDCEKAADIYAGLFSGSVQFASSNHAEILFSDSNRVILSKETHECPVNPGTLVWRISPEEEKVLRNRLQESGFSEESSGKKYFSYLDPWGNRNWFYYLSDKT
ncbi:hypothetical protein EHQ27_10130 [Leptospira wolffii]|uniref:hypothetical protein n=1 Tax=Leptospira wolffii TaxID=409998 RepID=UPI00034993C1|nr:hypothetical protein [Leptospira wolffii]TGK56776.1 hypothetical protein EHQ32_14400 [Leptospira wolffii]TGK71642.1 hypothetical protein EHQ27_10130 [Leptospira wolffii]TGK75501.1 hypothetical protein EHQ35_03775 [Leptospira wolffii]TGL33009.1 hypothetical protein EHQ57_00755 [Leptospira wolffii]